MKPTGHATSGPCRRTQRGAAAVEFGLVSMLLFLLLFGILEFGRYMYVANTLQEVTRRAARTQVVQWKAAGTLTAVREAALFGGTVLPAGAEITAASISIGFYNSYADAAGQSNAITGGGSDPISNLNSCQLNENDCIRFVRVSLAGATYSPMVPLLNLASIPLPDSTVIMPAEALGLLCNATPKPARCL